ncbi:MAG: peptide ABC transporter substrate-binding protein [Phycisphaerales bacterium]|nr:peptide ABC transporter substrate-binding protein [Phycisphaerales bacterium]
MRRLLLPFLLLAIAIGATVVTDRPQPPADFTFINRGDVTTLDLQKMSWMQDLRVARCLFEGLVRHDVFSAGYSLLPGVAERWEVSPDGLTYTFHLRSDARWSNGEPVTAQQFVYSWRRALLPDTASDYTALFQKIAGAEEFFDWRQARLETFKPDPGDDSCPLHETAAWRMWKQTEQRFTETVALRAIDDRTLTFTLALPFPPFLELCAFAVFYPVYPPLVSQYELPDRATGKLDIQFGWTKPPLMVSNGPFQLVTWRFRRDMRLERNPHYWDSGRIAIGSIAIPSIEDPNAAVLAFRSGGIDWLSDTSATYRAEILADKLRYYTEHNDEYRSLRAQGLDPVEIDRRLPPDPRASIHTFPAFGTYFYNFNCQPRLRDGRDNPFADPRVRRAFTMAIDKRRIVDEVRRVGEKVATTLIPPGSLAGYRSPDGLPFDPPAARRLLEEAGFPGGKGFITVELLFNKDGGHDIVAQAVARDWETHLGVNVELVTREIAVFKDDLKNQNYMIGRAGWFGDYGDPATFLDLSRRDDGNNDRKYDSPEFEGLMNRADREADPAKRYEILSRAESLIVDQDLPLIPIYHYVQMYMFDPHRLTGISSHPRQEQNMYEVDIFGDGKGSDAPKAVSGER